MAFKTTKSGFTEVITGAVCILGGYLIHPSQGSGDYLKLPGKLLVGGLFLFGFVVLILGISVLVKNMSNSTP